MRDMNPDDLEEIKDRMAMLCSLFVAMNDLGEDFDYREFDAQEFFETVPEEKIIAFFKEIYGIFALGEYDWGLD